MGEKAKGSDDNPSLDRADYFAFGMTAWVALTVYLLTLSPDVSLGFGGIFSTAAMHGGVPHPPGYPLSTIYTWAFVKLVPISNVAWRVAAASAVAGAVASGLIASIVSRLGAGLGPLLIDDKQAERNAIQLRVGAACCAGLLFAFSKPFWNRAVIADVWTLSVFCLCLVILFLLRWTQAPSRTGYLYCAFFTYGLALTNSQMLLALGPAIPFLLLAGSREVGGGAFVCGIALCGAGLIAAFLDAFPSLWVSREGIENVLLGYIAIGVVEATMALALVVKTRRLLTTWRTATVSFATFLGGLSLYLYVPIASMTNPPINWGYPRTVQGFFHVLSRGQYERIHPQTEVSAYLDQLWSYLDAVGSGFGWVALAMATIPFVMLRFVPRLVRHWLLASIAAFLCLGPVLIGTLNPAPDRQSWDFIGASLSLSLVVLAIWAGLGLILVGQWLLVRSRLH